MTLLIVDGDDPIAASVLAQHVAAVTERAGRAPHLTVAAAAGHPLRRPFEATSYRDAADWLETLRTQWRNFALRAARELATETRTPWIVDGGLVHAVAAEGALDLVGRLVEALEPVEPRLLLLRAGADSDPAATAATDALFATGEGLRALVNTPRSTLADATVDALGLLRDPDLPRSALEIPAPPPGAPGRYASGGDELLVEAVTGTPWAGSLRADPRPAGRGAPAPVYLRLRAPDLPPCWLLPAHGERCHAAGLPASVEWLHRNGTVAGLVLRRLDRSEGPRTFRRTGAPGAPDPEPGAPGTG